MNTKEKINQMQQIYSVLETGKNEILRNLERLKYMQNKRYESVNRITDYKRDYQQVNKNRLRESVPALLRNFDLFMKKLDDAIQQEMCHIQAIEIEKVELIHKINGIDLKMQAMELKSQWLVKKVEIRQEILETITIDELTQTKVREKL